ncbi:MAG TPA: extracellular solute-binding protein [Methylomirabilota bacterium]|nr:extracellular solute-binding protein [Methylomirabilota bacterium]
MTRALVIACFFLASLAALASPAAAQTKLFTPDRVDIAAAKREAAVTWYTSTPVNTAQKIANMFQTETGIKVELFRSGGSAVLRRFMQEIDARRVMADVMTISDPAEVRTLIKRDLVVPFRPRHFDKVRDEVKDPKGYHVAQRVNLVGIIARSDKGLTLPRNWTDLTDPRYKGLLVMPDPSYTAIQLMVIGTLSRKYGWGFYQKLRANEIMIVQSHQQVSETLTRGERLIAAEGGDQFAWLDRRAGHKIETIWPTDGAFAIGAPTVVIKGAPHPNAAKALAEFMISDAVQKLLPGEGIYAGRSDIEPPPGNPPIAQIKLIPVDYEQVEKDAKALKTRFNEIYQ